MNRYFIEHKISTLSELNEPFSHRGFEFSQWDLNYMQTRRQQAWIAKKMVEAINVTEAINSFRKELSLIVERLAFVSQCYFTEILQSYIIVKENNNPDKIFFLCFTNKVAGVPLHFNEDEKVALKKLDTYKKQPVFRYMKESTNASTYYTTLAMLIIALESIAGEKVVAGGNKVTDKDYIKNNIIKDDSLYEQIFEYGEGIRNKIFHGDEVEIDDEYVEKIYNKIINYFNEKCEIKINTGVTHPQRTPMGNYAEHRLWLEPTNKAWNVHLKDVVELYKKEQGGYRGQGESKFYELFSHADKPDDH